MKTQMSPELIAYHKSPASLSCFRVNLYTITLISGQVLSMTDGQVDIQFNGLTYYASKYGSWFRTEAIKTSLGLDSQETGIGVYAPSTVFAFGTSVSLLSAIYLGLFESCIVKIETLSMPTYGDVSMGSEIKFYGFQTDTPKIGRTEVNFKLNDWNYILNTQVPNRLITASCNWVLYGVGCGIKEANFAHSGVIVEQQSNSITVAQSLGQVPGYFTQGVLRFTSGVNSGLSYSIKSDAGGVFTLATKTFQPPAFQDRFTAFAGCDHSILQCTQRFSNLNNFGGFSFVPVPESAI
jgi:hypothetical protein